MNRMDHGNPILAAYYNSLKNEGVPVAHRNSHCLGFIDGWNAVLSAKKDESFGDWAMTIYPQMLDAENIPRFRQKFRLAGFRAGWEWHLANKK